MSDGIFAKGAGDVLVHVADLSAPDWPVRVQLRQLLERLKATILNAEQRHSRLVTILDPAEATPAGLSYTVRGTAPSGVDVWVVVHPVGHPIYFAQGHGRSEAGTWAVSARFGNVVSRGPVYEIRAFVEPQGNLAPGQQFTGWPTAAYSSQIRFVL